MNYNERSVYENELSDLSVCFVCKGHISSAESQKGTMSYPVIEFNTFLALKRLGLKCSCPVGTSTHTK